GRDWRGRDARGDPGACPVGSAAVEGEGCGVEKCPWRGWIHADSAGDLGSGRWAAADADGNCGRCEPRVPGEGCGLQIKCCSWTETGADSLDAWILWNRRKHGEERVCRISLQSAGSGRGGAGSCDSG